MYPVHPYWYYRLIIWKFQEDKTWEGRALLEFYNQRSGATELQSQAEKLESELRNKMKMSNDIAKNLTEIRLGLNNMYCVARRSVASTQYPRPNVETRENHTRLAFERLVYPVRLESGLILNISRFQTRLPALSPSEPLEEVLDRLSDFICDASKVIRSLSEEESPNSAMARHGTN